MKERLLPYIPLGPKAPSKNHLAYTIVLSAESLPKGLPKSLPKSKVGLDTSYPVGWIKSNCNILD